MNDELQYEAVTGPCTFSKDGSRPTVTFGAEIRTAATSLKMIWRCKEQKCSGSGRPRLLCRYELLLGLRSLTTPRRDGRRRGCFRQALKSKSEA